VQRRLGSDQLVTLCHRWARLIELATAYKTFLNQEVLVGPQHSCPDAFFVAQTTHTLLVIYYSFLYSLFDPKGVNLVTVTEPMQAELPPEAWEAREKAVVLWKSIERQMMLVRHKIGFRGEANYKGLELGYEQYRNINPLFPELIMMYLGAFFRYVHLHYDVKGPMANPPTEETARWLLDAAKEKEVQFADLLALDPRELVDDVIESLQLAITKRKS
jgi:hypothetical protein